MHRDVSETLRNQAYGPKNAGPDTLHIVFHYGYGSNSFGKNRQIYSKT